MGKQMVDIEGLKREILEQPLPLQVDRVILFGSYAHGNVTEENDIDLYVVTQHNYIPIYRPSTSRKGHSYGKSPAPFLTSACESPSI